MKLKQNRIINGKNLLQFLIKKISNILTIKNKRKGVIRSKKKRERNNNIAIMESLIYPNWIEPNLTNLKKIPNERKVPPT